MSTLIIPGTSRHARHYAALAREIGGTVMERRGRVGAPPQGPDYGLEQEVGDTIELLRRTGADTVFGHSYGGLIALHVGLRHDLRRLIVYEPTVSIGGSMRMDFLPEVDRLLDRGRDARALALFLSGCGFLETPRPVGVAVCKLMLATRDGRDLRAILRTLPAEGRVAARADCDGRRYTAITAPTLVLSGGRSPRYLADTAARLAQIIPAAKHVETPDFDHNAPDLGDPAAVAALIRA